MSFDPVEICAVLSEEGVEFVVLGGFAASIHGSPLPTENIDFIRLALEQTSSGWRRR